MVGKWDLILHVLLFAICVKIYVKYTPVSQTRWTPLHHWEIGQKIVSSGKNPKILTPLGNCPKILSPFEIEWKELHSKTISTRIFELETIDFLSPSSTGALRQGCLNATKYNNYH